MDTGHKMSECQDDHVVNLFGVVVFHTCMVNWRRERSEFSWCSGIPQIYDHLGGGSSEGTPHLKI